VPQAMRKAAAGYLAIRTGGDKVWGLQASIMPVIE